MWMGTKMSHSTLTLPAVCCNAVRAERRHVREVEVEKWLRATPSKSKGSTQLFRSLADKGQGSLCSL